VTVAPAGLADAAEGERKHVTVLFTDVVASMRLERELGDPEQMRNLMDRLFVTTCEIVERHGGTVQRFTGDGAMVLFGAPVAHEDHALRACMAAADLLDRVRELPGVALRIGLNSGEVVTATVGSGDRAVYTAFGPAVGGAKRAQSHASPGAAALTEATAALVSGRVRLRQGGESPVGTLHELVSIGGDPAHAPRIPMVGRAAELDTLRAARDRAEAGARAMTVWGEPGVGKTRLCEEFARDSRERGWQVDVISGVAHGRSVPLLPFVELLRRRLSLGPESGAAKARERLAEALAVAPGAAPEQALLEDLLGIAEASRPPERADPEARRRRLLGAIAALVLGGSRAAHLLVAEDLHWFDPASDQLLRGLVAGGERRRLLVVATARREPGTRQLGDAAIQLGALEEHDCDALVRHFLGAEPESAGLRRAVRGRSGGNPLFVREIARALEEKGRRFDLPPSVHAVVAARLDRLPPVQKALLRVVAVAGAGVGEPVLRTVAGIDERSFAAGVRGLIARDLLRAVTDQAYAASHSVVEEVAYGALLGAPRTRLHRAVALALEEHEPDRIDERAAILATHWERAGEPVRAAAMHLRAGMRAAFTDPARALRDHRHAWELADAAGAGPEAMNVRIQARAMSLLAAFRAGVPAGQSPEEFAGEMARIHDAGIRLAEEARQPAAAAVLAGSYANMERCLGAPPARTIPLALDAERRAAAAGDRAIQLAVAPAIVLVYWSAGRSREALETIDRFLDLMGDDHGLGAGLAVVSPRAFLLQYRGMCLVTMGQVPDGRRHFELGLEIAEEAGDLDSQMTGHNNLVSAADHDRVTDNVLRHAVRNHELAERAGNATGQALGYRALSAAHHLLGNPDEAVDAGRKAVRTLRESGTVRDNEAFVVSALAAALLSRGDSEEAHAVAGQAVEAALASGARGHQEIRARTVLARTLIARHGPAGVAAALCELDAADARIEDGGHVVFAPGTWEVRAEAALARGDGEAAAVALTRAADLAEQIGAPRRAALLRDRLGGREEAPRSASGQV
jgi:class 3 adenylate cyclase/tetratricopeptide (TPR) repeat protein